MPDSRNGPAIFRMTALPHRFLVCLLVGFALLGSGTRLAAQVVTAFSAGGLTSIQYGGVEFLASNAVQPTVFLQNTSGAKYQVGSTGSAFESVLK